MAGRGPGSGSSPVPHVAEHPASSKIDPQGKHKMSLSIWFFVGALCLMYGLVLLPLGVYQFSHPSETELRLPLLLKLHTTFWWGLLMTVFGGFYTVNFRPGKP